MAPKNFTEAERSNEMDEIEKEYRAQGKPVPSDAEIIDLVEPRLREKADRASAIDLEDSDDHEESKDSSHNEPLSDGALSDEDFQEAVEPKKSGDVDNSLLQLCYDENERLKARIHALEVGMDKARKTIDDFKVDFSTLQEKYNDLPKVVKSLCRHYFNDFSKSGLQPVSGVAASPTTTPDPKRRRINTETSPPRRDVATSPAASSKKPIDDDGDHNMKDAGDKDDDDEAPISARTKARKSKLKEVPAPETETKPRATRSSSNRRGESSKDDRK